VLPPTSRKPAHDDSGIMSMMKNWAGHIGDSLKGHMIASSGGPTDKSGIKPAIETPVQVQHFTNIFIMSSIIRALFRRLLPSQAT